MTALKTKPKATKYSDHRTISVIAHTAKIVARILRRTIKGKLRVPIEKNRWIQKRKRN